MSTFKTLFPKVYFQSSAYKSVIPKVYFQKSTSKGLLPKAYFQKSTSKCLPSNFTSKSLIPIVYFQNCISKSLLFQKSTSKSLLPKICFQKSTSKKSWFIASPGWKLPNPGQIISEYICVVLCATNRKPHVSSFFFYTHVWHNYVSSTHTPGPWLMRTLLLRFSIMWESSLMKQKLLAQSICTHYSSALFSF